MPRPKRDPQIDLVDDTAPRIMDASSGDGRTTKRERISLPLAPDGQIDWEHTRQQSKDKLATALASNPDAFKNFGVGKVEKTPGLVAPGPVTPEHFSFLLTLYEMGERNIIPGYIKKQSKGQVVISPEIAAIAFQFTPDQREKICPLGAQVLNEKLPDWLKAWIAKTGPVSELLSLMAAATYMQTQVALKMWKQDASGSTVEEQQPQPVQ